MKLDRKCAELHLETDDDTSISSFDARVQILTPANCTTPPHLSNYLFEHYLPRRPLTAFAFANPHSLDDAPVFQHRPKSRNFMDFTRQHRPETRHHMSHTFGPGHYSPNYTKRPTHVPNFSRQISREKADFRSRRETFTIIDRSLSRSCSLTLPRKRTTIFYSPLVQL